MQNLIRHMHIECCVDVGFKSAADVYMHQFHPDDTWYFIFLIVDMVGTCLLVVLQYFRPGYDRDILPTHELKAETQFLKICSPLHGFWFCKM